MRLRNTAEGWGAVAKLVHWAGAVLTLAMLGLGLVMVHAGLASAPKFEAYQLHKPTGFLILAVTVARGLWRMAISPPASPNGMRPWERRLARALHLGLYVLILAMIASGWLMVSASPLPIPTHLPFGFIMPNLTSPNALIEARAKFTLDRDDVPPEDDESLTICRPDVAAHNRNIDFAVLQPLRSFRNQARKRF